MAKFFTKPVACEAYRVPPLGDTSELPPRWLLQELLKGGAVARPDGGIQLGSTFAPVGHWLVLEPDSRMRVWHPDEFARGFTKAPDGVAPASSVAGGTRNGETK